MRRMLARTVMAIAIACLGETRRGWAQAMAIPFNGFDGLRLRCVIEQRVPGEREIAAALVAPRVRAA